MSENLPGSSSQAIAPWKKRLPMWLTMSRMAVCPIFIVLLSIDNPVWDWVAAALFILASLTDWLDGHYARKYGAISNFGKFMDPIADKILVASVLIMMIPTGRVGPVIVILLLTRDILIGGIRSIAAADNLIIDAKATGKWKTGLQMVSIPVLLVHKPMGSMVVFELGLVLLWISVILSLISGYQYVRVYLDSRRGKAA